MKVRAKRTKGGEGWKSGKTYSVVLKEERRGKKNCGCLANKDRAGEREEEGKFLVKERERKKENGEGGGIVKHYAGNAKNTKGTGLAVGSEVRQREEKVVDP